MSVENSSEKGERQRIVLIDDEPGVVLALKLLLQTLGFEVEGFNEPLNGVQYIAEKIEQNAASLAWVLCDLRMPKKNGFEVLVDVKILAPHLPFILMSGHAEEAEIKKGIELGAMGFLSKPFSPEDFFRLIGR